MTEYGSKCRSGSASEVIQLDIVWRTVQDDLPPLIAQLEPLVPPEPE